MPISKDDFKPVHKPVEAKPEKKVGPEKPEPEVLSGITPAMKSELDALGVDPRLDNRTGDQRPQEVAWPAKPQQVDSGDKPKEIGKPTGKALGSESKGPHGLGEKE